MVTDRWHAWRSLIGSWEGGGTGTPGEGAGRFAFTVELGGQLLVRRGRTEYPATAERPAFTFEDLMVVHPAGDAWRADFFDSEGHVIRYAVEVGPAEITFTSAADAGPRFRLRYRAIAPDQVAIEFAIAPPGSPEAFAAYVAGAAYRTGSTSAASSRDRRQD